MPRAAILSVAGIEWQEDLSDLRPGLRLARVQAPVAGWKEATFELKAPGDAVPGESYVLDVAQWNGNGQPIGGIRLEVNVL